MFKVKCQQSVSDSVSVSLSSATPENGKQNIREQLKLLQRGVVFYLFNFWIVDIIDHYIEHFFKSL